MDDNNEAITIDSDAVLQRAVQRSYREASAKSERVVLRLIISQGGSGASPGLSERKKKSTALQGSVGLVDLYGEQWSDLSNKKGLLNDLKASTSLSPQELERIYNAFTKVVK